MKKRKGISIFMGTVMAIMVAAGFNIFALGTMAILIIWYRSYSRKKDDDDEED